MKMLRLATALALLASPAFAQNGTVTSHAFAVGKGPGVTGFTSLLCTSAQLAVGQAAADPICQTITGDVTISAGGVTAIGTAKVVSAMLGADVFSTAHSWSGQQTFTAPVLGTPASATLTNATGLPIGTGISGLATGIASFLATPSSANLRAALTDEVGTGAAYFIGGALGTPASATLTNATGLPVGGIAAIGANTIVSNATGSSASPAAVSMPSCSGANQALTWTSGTGPGCTTISGGGGGGTNIQTANYTVTTSDCTKTVEMGTGSTGYLTLTLPAATGFSEGCTVKFKNGDTAIGKLLSGFPSPDFYSILWPSQAGEVQIVNGAWVSTRTPGRWKLTPNTTYNFYSDFVNGVDTNDCLANTSGRYCKTLQHVMDIICDQLDLAASIHGGLGGQTKVVANLQASTTDTSGLHWSCHSVVGAQGGAAIMIQGQGGSVISTTSTDALGFFIHDTVQVRNLTLQTTTSGSCINAQYQTTVELLDQMRFNACANSQISASDSGTNVWIDNSYSIFGGAQFHFAAQNGAVIRVLASVVATFGANATYSTFALAQLGGQIIANSWSFNLNTFTVTGPRAQSNYLANIFVSSAGCLTTFFPGNSNGTTAGGGQCN